MPESKKRGGGPKTPEGKRRASENSTKHGARATKFTILADESPEEYEETRNGWLTAFEPEGYHEIRLVDQLIVNDWLLKRANRRFLETEAEWAEEPAHTAELMQRYRTAAERSFYRSLSAVEQLRKDILRNEIIKEKLLSKNRMQEERIEALEKELGPGAAKARVKPAAKKADAPATLAQQTFQGQRSKKKRRKIEVLDQWIEIEVTEQGKTVTTLYPPNDVLIENGQKMWPPPELVYRRLHFVNGVPPEYRWTTKVEAIRATGGMGVQRMTVERWLELIAEEKAAGTGHVLPCGGNLPRPEERGGCDCEVCTHNRKVLELRAG